MADDSDGVDEFAASFSNDAASTSPFRAVRYVPSSSKHPARNGQAGPSTKAGASAKRRRSPEAPVIDISTEPDGPPKPKRAARQRSVSREPESAPATKSRNTAQSKGKGKARAAPEHVENLDIIEEEHNIEVQEIPTTSRQATKPAQTRTVPKTKNDSSDQKQIAKLQKRLEEVLKERDHLAQLIEELNRERKTEPEEALQITIARYEARLKVQEDLIKEQTSQLARSAPMLEGGKTSPTLHFITREAAEEERRDLIEEVARLKAALANEQRERREKDEQIQILETDLAIEREQYKKLASSRPAAVSHATKGGRMADPQKQELVRLYEDMSNLLVTDIKFENINASGEQGESVVFKCVYSHGKTGKALPFSLRVSDDPSNPASSKDDKRVLYTPDPIIENETEEYREKLSFLADSFTFPRAQMDAFYDRLTVVFGDMDSDTEEQG